MKRYIYWSYILLMTLAIGATSCESEIDVDYNHVSPQLVLNGIVTPDSIIFTLQETVDVTTPLDAPVALIEAEMQISGDDGTVYALTRKPADSNRFVALTSTGEMRGATLGVTYTAQAQVGDDIIQGTSMLTESVPVENFAFEWVAFMADRENLFITFDWQDNPDESNYYHILIKRENGEAYTWDVRSDEGENGNRIFFLERCMSSEDTPEDEPEEYLEDGEKLIVEMRQIDAFTYDYLVSVQVGEDMSANPVPFYSLASCLGYFEACSPTRYIVTYQDAAARAIAQ